MVEIQPLMLEKDLRRWFKEEWVDVSRKDKDGKHPPCGRDEAKTSSKGYPKCRPSKKVSSDTPKTTRSMSPQEKKAATRRKRSKPQGVGGKPTMVKMCDCDSCLTLAKAFYIREDLLKANGDYMPPRSIFPRRMDTEPNFEGDLEDVGEDADHLTVTLDSGDPCCEDARMKALAAAGDFCEKMRGLEYYTLDMFDGWQTDSCEELWENIQFSIEHYLTNSIPEDEDWLNGRVKRIIMGYEDPEARIRALEELPSNQQSARQRIALHREFVSELQRILDEWDACEPPEQPLSDPSGLFTASYVNGISWADVLRKKSEKPFHGYNPNRHSREGGLNAKGRAKFKREEGANLKPPVTEKPSTLKPGSKKAKRRKSFCARMSGVKGPTSKEGKLTPKGAALKRWNC
jgi:hypothetical protein